MGAVTGMLGLGGGASGTGFGGPVSNPADPTGNANLENSYNQLQGIANGTGPNPAQAQYFQNVQGLARQQAGAIGSVQGISPALAARMASQQGSAAMQNAAAAGGANLATQQLGAMGQAANVAGTQGNIAAGMQQNVNNANAGLAQTTMGNQMKTIGGLFNGAAGASGLFPGGGAGGAAGGSLGGGLGAGIGAAHGGMIPQAAPSMSMVGRYMCGGSVGSALKAGGAVPGRAQVAGDSSRNDTVAAKLSPGEIVLPRSIVNSKNAPAAAAKFVAALQAKKGKR
jgi:hypothetical protein